LRAQNLASDEKRHARALVLLLPRLRWCLLQQPELSVTAAGYTIARGNGRGKDAPQCPPVTTLRRCCQRSMCGVELTVLGSFQPSAMLRRFSRW
jgi:hypothetical protein